MQSIPTRGSIFRRVIAKDHHFDFKTIDSKSENEYTSDGKLIINVPEDEDDEPDVSV